MDRDPRPPDTVYTFTLLAVVTGKTILKSCASQSPKQKVQALIFPTCREQRQKSAETFVAWFQELLLQSKWATTVLREASLFPAADVLQHRYSTTRSLEDEQVHSCTLYSSISGDTKVNHDYCFTLSACLSNTWKSLPPQSKSCYHSLTRFVFFNLYLQCFDQFDESIRAYDHVYALLLGALEQWYRVIACLAVEARASICFWTWETIAGNGKIHSCTSNNSRIQSREKRLDAKCDLHIWIIRQPNWFARIWMVRTTNKAAHFACDQQQDVSNTERKILRWPWFLHQWQRAYTNGMR